MAPPQTLLRSALVALMLPLLLAIAAAAQDAGKTIDFARLAHPEVADQLQLTDQQRLDVQRLLNARAIALSTTPPDQRATVLANSDTELSAVLTDRQREKFQQLGTIKKLQFNFVNQKWQLVLEWFAEQANMTLVYDRLPEQPFNYRDDRQYTVREAIDVLNGILLAKGFTLVRRDQLLVVVDLKTGVAEELIPKTTLDKLDEFGQFEMVRLMIPIEGRPADAVLAEVTPLVGPLGKVAALPQSRQVMVTETAGKMRAIQAVIEAIPEPKKPEQPKPPAPKPDPPKPVFMVHRATGLDVSQTIETLKELIPEAKFTGDTTAQQIRAYAVPSAQEAIKGALEQMSAEVSPENRPLLKSYPLPSVDSEALTAQIKAMIGTAQVAVDTERERLLVFARPDQHEQIAQALSVLDQPTLPPEVSADVQLVTLQHADVTDVSELLQSLFPDDSFIPNAATRSLAIRANSETRATIDQLIKQLDVQAEAPNQPTLKTYAILPGIRESLTSLVPTLAPQATLSWQADGRRVLVLAAPQEHDKLQQALQTLSADPPTEAPTSKIRFYSYPAALDAQVETLLAHLPATLGSVTTVDKSKPGERTLLTTDEQHTHIQQLIDELLSTHQTREATALTSIPLEHTDSDAIVEWLSEFFPGVRVKGDPTANRVLVWADDTTRDEVAAAVQQLDTADRVKKQEKLISYRLPRLEGDSLVTALRDRFPEMVFHNSWRDRRVLAWGTDEDHARLQEVIKELEGSQEESRRDFRIYDTGRYDPSDIQELVAQMFSDVRTSIDRSSRTIMVSASTEQHDLIRKAMDQLPNPEANDTRVMKSYPVHPSNLRSADDLVRQMIPGITAEVTREPPRLIVFATPEQQERITELLPVFSGETPDDQPKSARRYDTPAGNASYVVELLREAVPEAEVHNDGTSKGIVAVATDDDHRRIDEIAKLFLTQGEGKLRAVVYPVDTETAYQARRGLSSLDLYATVVEHSDPRQSIVVAEERVHEVLKGLLQQIMDANAAKPHQTSEIYSVHPETLDTLVETLQQEFESIATVTASSDGRHIVVRTAPENHAQIKTSFESLRKKMSSNDDLVAKTYRLEVSNIETAFGAISNLMETAPNVTLSLDEPQKAILAVAPQEQHDRLQQIIASIVASAKPDQPVTLVNYALKDADGTVIQTTVQALLKDNSQPPQLQLDTTNNQLIAVATAEQHRIIQTSVDAMRAPERQMELFQLAVNDVVTVQLSIDQLFSDLPTNLAPLVDSNSEMQQLIVRATPEQMQKIRELLAKLGESTTESSRNENMRVITLHGNVPAAIEQLQRAWPSIQPNTLRVIYPADSSQPAGGTSPLFRPAPEGNSRDKSPAGGSQFSVADTKDKPSTGDPAEPPVLVIPGSDKVTIVSQDPEALDKLESLLRILAPPRPIGGTQVMVYGLRSANVSDVADMLRRLFRESTSFIPGQVVVIPDTRLNALVVYASPRHHEMVEQLIQVLDGTDESVEANANKPRIIPVLHTPAQRIMEILESVYKTQLASGGGRKRVEIPEGISSDVAQVLQQINAASAGPLLTLHIDETTNSIIALGPPLLLDEITELVNKVDSESVSNDTRSVRVIPLKSVNSEILQEALQEMMNRRSSRSSR